MANPKAQKVLMHFKTMVQGDVPQGRDGKHKLIVTTILKDLDELEAGSALNRATRKAGRKVATAADADYLYVWNENQ